MRCVICRQGNVRPGVTTVTLEPGGVTLVIKQVPARVCDTCGETYVDEDAAQRLLGIAEEVAGSGVQVDVREYRAA